MYDEPWKEALTAYFPDFLALFFPEAYEGIDWRAKCAFLDKELAKIHPDSEQGSRIVDKLVQVRRRDGANALVLVHVEVQAQADPAFERRMLEYHARIFAHYDRPVVSLAVLADDRPAWRPSGFGYELWGCRLRLDFPAAKLLDFSWEELAKNPNPFAAVVQAHLKAKATSKDSPIRKEAKLAVVKGLLERGLAKKAIRRLFRFIDGLLELNDDLNIQFMKELAALEAEKDMPYITSIERIGIEKGREKGLQEGREEGRLAMARENVEQVLEARFGTVPPSIRKRIRAVDDLDELRRLVTKASKAPSLEAFASDRES